MPDLVAILGMGRSGTSLAAQILHAAGGYFGKEENLIPADKLNERGYYEHKILEMVNISILKDLFGVTWLFLGGLPVGWETWEQTKVFYDAALKHLKPEIKKARELGKPFCWKDPRITRLLPFWRHVFERLELNVETILCWRHPAQVYLSLYPRDPVERAPETVQHFHQAGHPHLHRDDVYAIWAEYMTDGLEAGPAVVINYDDWFKGRAPEIVRKITEAAGLEKKLSGKEVSRIVEPRLQHFRTA